MKRILIVDDEEPARYELEHYLEKTGLFNIIDKAQNSTEALKLILKNKYHAIFLDINMPGINGIELAKIISSTNNINIIFVTAYNEYAIDAFNVAAIDYILKPIEYERLLVSIKRLEEKNNNSENIISMIKNFTNAQNNERIIGKKRSSTEKVFLNINDILFFKAYETDCYVFTENGEKWIVGGTIKKYEEKYSHQFIRTHRAYLVNINKIESFKYFIAGSYKLKVYGMKDKIPVSRAYSKKFKEKLKI